MKRIITLLIIFTISYCFAGSTHVTSAKKQASLTPEASLQKLIEGNQRYFKEQQRNTDQPLVLKKVVKGQHPFAFIFNCVDSRSVPELLFDQNLGNIFVGRVAGNVVDKNILGSMEFATKVTGANLIVIMGHTACGAIAGACANVKLGNITQLLQQITPAVSFVKKAEGKKFSCESQATIDAIAKQNVLKQMHYVINNSYIIDKLIKEKKVMLVGAMHTLATGKVTFFNIDGQTIE